MIRKKQVFLAIPMDLVSESTILKSISEFKKMLSDLPLVVDTTYKSNDNSVEIDNYRTNKEIVENGLKKLRSSDILIVDYSKDYDYFGCICEIVYAYLMKIPTIVYIGDKKNINRPYLHYHVKYVARTSEDIINNLKELLKY